MKEFLMYSGAMLWLSVVAFILILIYKNISDVNKRIGGGMQ